MVAPNHAAERISRGTGESVQGDLPAPRSELSYCRPGGDFALSPPHPHPGGIWHGQRETFVVVTKCGDICACYKMERALLIAPGR